MEMYLIGYVVAFVMMSLLNHHDDEYFQSSLLESVVCPLFSWVLVAFTLLVLAYYYKDYKKEIK